MSKTILSLITMVALATISIEAQDKNIGVVANYSMTSHSTVRHSSYSANYNDTILYANSVKEHYNVEEAIQIRLKLKRDAYIYFWTISSDGKGYLILPNNFESFDKYVKSKAYVIPNRSAKYDFVSDRAGIEKIYVLATDKRMPIHRIRKVFNQKVGGIIPIATSKSIGSFISKDIHIIAKEDKFKYDLVNFSIRIHEKELRHRTQTSININSFH